MEAKYGFARTREIQRRLYACDLYLAELISISCGANTETRLRNLRTESWIFCKPRDELLIQGCGYEKKN